MEDQIIPIVIKIVVGFFFGWLSRQKRVQDADKALETVVESIEEREGPGLSKELGSVKNTVMRKTTSALSKGAAKLIDKAVKKIGDKF